MLIEKFNGTVLSLKDVKTFVERAETLGYVDRTPIGLVGVGIDLWVETPLGAKIYRCDENGCGREFQTIELSRQHVTGDWILPHHTSASRPHVTCTGSGKKGVASS